MDEQLRGILDLGPGCEHVVLGVMSLPRVPIGGRLECEQFKLRQSSLTAR